MQPEPEFAEQYTKAEAIRIVVMGTLAGALIIIFSKAWLFPWIREFAISAPCRKVWGIEGLTVLWYGVFVGLPLFNAILIMPTLGWLGYKILRDGQFPPANVKVFRPTKIRRGPKAKLIGYMHILVCLPLLALSIWGGFQAEKMTKTMRPKAGMCATNPGDEGNAPQAALPLASRP